MKTRNAVESFHLLENFRNLCRGFHQAMIALFKNNEKYKICNTCNHPWAGVVGAVGKMSAFRPQGSQFDLCRDSKIIVTFFSA